MGPFQTSLLPSYQHSSAIISKCSSYRYLLRRVWDDTLPPLVAGFLNPSTADAATDDPTITRMVQRAKCIGCGSIVIWNVFGYRATDPKELATVADPVGRANFRWIALALREARATDGKAMVGWGAHDIPEDLLRRVRKAVELAGVRLTCLGTTKAGHPRHPLYVSYATDLRPWQFPN